MGVRVCMPFLPIVQENSTYLTNKGLEISVVYRALTGLHPAELSPLKKQDRWFNIQYRVKTPKSFLNED